MNLPSASGMRAAPGLTGGIVHLSNKDWVQKVRDEVSKPDQPYDPRNDHYRTVYAQMLTPGPYQKAVGPVAIGAAVRLTFGISNGRVRVIYDVPANGSIHAAICAESLFGDVATIQTLFPLVGGVTPTFTQTQIDNPPIVVADTPPDMLIGLLRNQALSLNPIQTPKRTIAVAIAAGGVLLMPVPSGSQAVRVMGSSAGNISAKQRLLDATTEIAFPVNVETPLAADVSRIRVDATAGETVAVAFSFGI